MVCFISLGEKGGKEKMNPKKKGGAYELEIARDLSLWYTEGKRDDIFFRSHSSGARATMRSKSGKRTKGQYGDLCASDPIGEPLIKVWTGECKSGYGRKATIRVKGKRREGQKVEVPWCILDILDSSFKLPKFLELWGEATAEAKAARGTVPILFLRRLRKASLIVMPHYEYTKWRDVFGGNNIPAMIQIRRVWDSEIDIMNLNDFFIWTKEKPYRRFKQNVFKGKHAKVTFTP